MKELRFQGFSDDVFSIIEPKEFADEIDCYNSIGVFTLWSEVKQCGVEVWGEYMNQGWEISVRNPRMTKDCRLFDFIRVRVQKGDYEHSPILIAECPDDVVVTSNQSEDE